MDNILVAFIAVVVLISVLSVFHDMVGVPRRCEGFSDRLTDMPPKNAADIAENQDHLNQVEEDATRKMGDLNKELTRLDLEIKKNTKGIKEYIASQKKQMEADKALQKEVGDKLKQFTSPDKKDAWIKPPPKGDLPGPIQ